MCSEGVDAEPDDEYEEEEPPARTIEEIVSGWTSPKGREFLDGVHRRFTQQFRDQLGEADIEEAIARVIDKMLAKPSPVALRYPEGYLIKSVQNTLRNALRRIIPGELPDDDLLADRRVSPEERELAAELLEMVRRRVNQWTNRNMAVVTMAYVEAHYYGEPIDTEAIQQIVLDTTGEDLTRTNVTTLLSRGRARLIKALSPTLRPAPTKEDDDD